MQCFFSPLAEIDLEEIGDFIARDNPARAVSFIQEIGLVQNRVTLFDASQSLTKSLYH
jgi:toxin ParE1/3/4